MKKKKKEKIRRRKTTSAKTKQNKMVNRIDLKLKSIK
jgi:hypothetical protein